MQVSNPPSASAGSYMTEEDKKQVFKRLIALIKTNRLLKLHFIMKFLQDKDKVSLGEMVVRTVTQMEALSLRFFNRINVAYYLNRTARSIEISQSQKAQDVLSKDLMSFHVYH